MRPRLAASALVAVALIVAACGSDTSPTWTGVPSGQPSAGPTASAAPSGLPSPSAAPASPSPAPSPAPTPVAGGWSVVKTAPCPDESRFTCVTLAVPKDHFVAGGPTWEVTYAIHRAAGTPKGMFVTITGGPGSSGISVADSYSDAFPDGVEKQYDVVFLDQRGIGLSGPIQCAEATAAFYGSTARPQEPSQAAAAGAAAAAYVTACLAEAKVAAADLPFYATRQAVEDLEAIREQLGAQKLHLYGESYGTQFVQTYASAHPDRIDTLFLDGPVDLTLDGASFYAEAGRAFDDVLIATLNTCATDEACATDHEGATPLATYDALAARLAGGPIAFDYPMPDGTVQSRAFALTDLENAAVSYLYSPFDRWLLQRALASAVDDDLVPLARLAYEGIAVNPDTLEVEPDPTYSDALYYAVECQDYVYNGGVPDGDARLAAFLATGRVLGVDRMRLGSVYYGDLPCIYWPNDPPADPRPAPIIDAPYQTIILGATGDPITPPANLTRLANRLTRVHTFITTGGPHITFGWGEACPDEAMGRYLLEGKLPEGTVTVCPGAYVDEYVPVAADAPSDYADALALASAMDDQVVGTDDYSYRLEDEPLAIGCDHGGSLTYAPTDEGTGLTLAACEFTEGLPVTGSGAIDDESGGLEMTITIPDGTLTYSRDGDGNRSVTGTFRGKPVDLRSEA
jgi:pimeloyl-ACP methyl ester carboxylesterase